MRRSVFFAVGLAVCLNLLGSAQQVGPNVNVLSGIDPLTGDAYLQRQNEPAVAISSRNADHVMLAFNDYRTVDIAFDVTEPDPAVFAKAKATGAITTESVRTSSPPEAWIGLAFSRDRGRTFYNALLPGYPQDPSAVGKASPVYGDSAGSDPVLISGKNGRVYLFALTFDRGGISRITSTRFTDRNSVEGGEPFYFDVTKQIDRGSASSKGRFADKPSAAVYMGGASSSAASPGNSKKKQAAAAAPGCERLHIAYTMFEGNDANGNFRSSILTSVSTNCGESWSNAIKVSAPFSSNGANSPGRRNQGTAMAVDPDNGDVYIAWRTYGPDGMVYVKSTDGGQTYSNPRAINTSPLFPYDQPLLKTTDGTNVSTFRSNGYPALAVLGGLPIAVWSERIDLVSGAFTATGVPRAVITVGTPKADGSIGWSLRHPIDLQDTGAPLGKRCEQVLNPNDSAVPLVECRNTGAQVMPYVAAQNGQATVVYYEARSDAQAPGGIAQLTGYISGMQRQVDVRGALINPANWTTTRSFQISRYQIDSSTGKIKQNPSAPAGLQPRVNYANYPMYLGGIAPFIGDYIHAIPLRPDGSGSGFRVAFTSNEFVEPPATLDFTQYTKPQLGLPPQQSCNAGSRNSTIMTAEIGTDLVVGSPGTFKQLVNEGTAVQRAFAVYAENHTPGFRAFRMTVVPGTGVQASFEQFGAPVLSVDVEILGSSSVTRTVFLSGNVATGSAVVNVVEIPLYQPGTTILMGAVPRGLTASLTLNGDPTNPFVGGADGNPGLATTETHTPQLGTPQLGTPQLGTPQLGSPQLGTPQLGTPQLGTPQLGSAQVSAPQLGSNGPVDPYITDVTYKVTNLGNTASGFNALVTQAQALELQQSGHTFQVIAYRVHQTASVNGCAIGKAQQDQVIYMTPQLGTPQLGTPQLGTADIGAPQLGTPQLGTPQLGTPQLGTPQLGTTQLATASFTVAPADPTPHDHDGTQHEHQGHDFIMLDLRITHPLSETPAQIQAELPGIVAGYAVGVQAQAVDTNDPDGEADSVFIDNVAPDTSVLSGPPANTSNPTAAFAFAGTDNLSTPSSLVFECKLDGIGAFAACPGSTTFTVPPGQHTLEVRAKDQAGNVDPTPETRTWVVDVLPPDTTIVSGPTQVSGPNVLFGFGGTDNVTAPAALTFECSLDGGAFAACPASAPYNGLSAGPHTLNVRATDLAGNVDPTPASQTWTVDTIPPDTTIVSGPMGGSGPNVLFGFGGTDNLTAPAALTFECSLDGGVFAACPASTPYNGLAPGSHTLNVQAIDLAGNVDPSPASRTWLVDNTPPDTSILTGPFANTINPAGPFTFAGTDNFSPPANLTFECSLDGGAYAACPAATIFTVPAGPHSLSVRARDEAGNLDPSPAASSWTVMTQSFAITGVTPGTAAAGLGQLITVFTNVYPEFGNPTAYFTQGNTFAQGFGFGGASRPGEYFVRLPFPGDSVPDGNGSNGLVPGAATVRLVMLNGSSQEFPITVSATPGTPQDRYIYGLSQPPTAGNPCGGPMASPDPVSSAYAGDGIAVSAYGIDTTGATAVFTQGNTVIEVPWTCALSGSFGVAATFTVPASLVPGAATVQLKTKVNALSSALGNALPLTIAEPIGFRLGLDASIGNGPEGIAVGDLNDDGKLDAVSANFSGNSVSVLLGNGQGGFTGPTNYSTGGGSRDVQLADLTGDGKLDLIVAKLGGNLSVGQGNGDGTFQLPLIGVTVAGQPNRIAVADINGDGIADIVVAKNGDTATNNVAVLLGSVEGFLPEMLFSAGTFAWDIGVADFNGDGRKDLVVSNRGNASSGERNVSVFLNDGSPSLFPQTGTSYPALPDGGTANLFDLAVADWNGDGLPDVVVGTNQNLVSILLGTWQGGFGSPQIISGSFARPTLVAAADFNGDGMPDIAIGSFDPVGGQNRVSVLRAMGAGYFAAPLHFGTGATSPSAIAAGDFDGDGKTDVVFTRKSSSDPGAVGILRSGQGTLDLIVSAMTHSPASPTAADLITFTATVKNLGDGNAPASTLMFKIGTETAGAPATLVNVPALGPGDTFTKTRQATQAAASYVNTATADYGAVVAEGDETNNTATHNYTVTPSESATVNVLPGGGLTPGQSFNETRAVEALVQGTSPVTVSSMTLTGLNLFAGALVGARIYDNNGVLIGNLDVTVPAGTGTVTLPVSATLSPGSKYRLGFYVQTNPTGQASGTFGNFPGSAYEASPGGWLQIQRALQSGTDAFPTNPNSLVPQITINVSR